MKWGFSRIKRELQLTKKEEKSKKTGNYFSILSIRGGMNTSFTCSVVSAQDQGRAHIETLSCRDATRAIEVARVSFPPAKLNVIDINAKRRFLAAKYHGNKAKILGALEGIFKNAGGGQAAQALTMPDLADVAVITGGIYFAGPLLNWPQTGEQTRQGDGFVWYKPDPKKMGHVLSEQLGNFISGGYLLIDFKGNGSLKRLSAGKLQKDAADFLKDYRLIIQSNLILVDNGKEDGNSDQARHALAALSVQQDGNLSLVVAAAPGKPSNGFGFSYKEFGELLVSWGSRYAINLDGGPSAQMAVRKAGCKNTKNPEACVESLIHHSDETNRMPQLFSVSK